MNITKETPDTTAMDKPIKIEESQEEQLIKKDV